MYARPLRAALALATLASLLISGSGSAVAAAPSCAGGSTAGCWSGAFSPFGEFDAAPPQTPADSKKYPAAASAVVLPNGRILYWNGLQDLEDSQPLPADAGRTARNAKTRMLDLSTPSPTFIVPNPETPGGHDMFCADNRLLVDGRVIVAGGTVWKTDQDIPDEITGPNGPDGGAELYGAKDTHLFRESDPTQWSLGSEMGYGRWYPSMVTQPDGKVFIAGGVEKLLYNSNLLGPTRSPYPENVSETETWDPATGVWTDNGTTAEQDLPLFARLHLLPNGKIFYSGAGQMWGPAGESVNQAEWNNQMVYDPASKTWSDVGSLTLGARSGAFSAQLPLKAPYDTAEFLLGGGVLGTSPGTYIATNLSEKVTVGPTGTVTSTLTGGMANRRWYSSAVVLPNGNVVALNGANADEVVMPGFESPVRQAELWNGTSWTPLSSGGRDRTYHNSAILLADGSVLVGGHAPINNYYGGQGQNASQSPGGTNNLKDPSFERFYPPYLYNGTRPAIVSTSAQVTWGSDLSLAFTGAAPAKVVLSRLPSVTHTIDGDQRTVELGAVTSTGAGTATASVPASASVLPPGYYYAFGLSADGTPSVATIVKVSGAPTGGTATPVEIN